MKDTKEKILETALGMFADYGFAGASTRELSKRANVNISAINYYFASKEGLYLSVIEYIIDLIKKDNKEIIELLAPYKDKKLDKDTAIKVFKVLIDNLIDRILKADVFPIVMMLIRETVKPSIGSDLIYKEITLPFYSLLSVVISSIIDIDIDKKMAIIIMYTIFGQATSFIGYKSTVLKTLELKDFDDKTIELIKEVVLKQSFIILNSYKN